MSVSLSFTLQGQFRNRLMYIQKTGLPKRTVLGQNKMLDFSSNNQKAAQDSSSVPIERCGGDIFLLANLVFTIDLISGI